jgi:hypothetical protein
MARIPQIKVLYVNNGKLRWEKVYDFGSFLAKQVDQDKWLAWAKGRPLLWGRGRRYTYLITPEIAWTLSDKEIAAVIRKAKEFLAAKYLEGLDGNQGHGETGGPGQPQTSTAPQPSQPGGAPSQTGIDPEDDELASHTFNPSTLFDDKTQAEWFGNLVKNAEADALKAIKTQVNKLPRWVWLLVGLTGFLLGIVVAAYFGGLSHPVTTTTGSGPIPPPPAPGTGAGIVSVLGTPLVRNKRVRKALEVLRLV